MEFFKGSIIGERDNQEDYGLIQTYQSNNSLIAIVADGMGGQIAGEIASSKAVESFLTSFEKNTTENVSTKLAVALQNANHELNRLITSNPKLSGMGCTLLSVVISRSSLNWISVGDSILYLYRSQRLTKLNDDHSMYPVLLESFKKGKISEEEMRTHPNRNALRSALTGDEIPIIDLKESSKTLEKNDILILATDGLLTLSEKDIQEILNANYNNSAENICKKLLIEVSDRKRRKQDNTLIEVIKISEGAAGSSLSTNKVLYILLFLFFTVLISSAIVFWPELNSFFTVKTASIPVATKPEVVVAPKPFQIEQSPVPVTNQENTPDKEKTKTNDDIKVASKDNNKAVTNGKQKTTGKAQEINKALVSPEKNTSKDSPPQPKLDSKSGDLIVDIKDKPPVDSASNKSSAEKAHSSDSNKSQVQIDVEADNKNIEKKIQNSLDEYLKNKSFN
jgi:serine/threonine protein phosphatase PrpC